MSGKKRITVDSYEYNRLLRDSRNLADTKRAYNALQQMLDASNNTLTRLRSDNNALSERISALNTAVRSGAQATSELRNQLAAQARANRQALSELSNDFNRRTESIRDDLMSQMETLNNSVNDRIEANNRIINNTIERNTAMLRNEMQGYAAALNTRITELDSHITSIDNTVSGMLHSDADLLEMARDYYASAQQLIEETGGFLTFLDAEGYNNAINALNIAASEITLTQTHSTNASAARISASNAYRTALETQHRIISEQIIWQNARENAYNCISVAAAQIAANETLQISENFDSPYSMSVDYWANGSLGELRERLQRIQRNLDNAESSRLTIDDIAALQHQALNIIEEIQNVSAFALSAFNASVERYDIVNGIAKDPHFTMLGERHDGYEGEDDRSSYRMTMVSGLTHDEIVLTVNPVVGENGLISNQINVDLLNPESHNTSIISESQEIFMNDILAALRNMGRKAPDRVQSDVGTIPGYEHNLSNMAPPDMEAWASAKPEIPSYPTGSLPTPNTSARPTPSHGGQTAAQQRQ